MPNMRHPLHHNQLVYLLKPSLEKWPRASQQTPSIEVLLCRLRIDHTCLTHRFLLWGEDPPQWEHCEGRLTVLHIWARLPLDAAPSHFPLLFQTQYSLPPSFFLGEEPLVPFNTVIKILKEAGALHLL